MIRKILLSTVLFLIFSGIANSQNANVEDLYWFTSGDGVSVEFDLYWEPFTFGNAYIETQIGREGFSINGYTYEGINYKDSDLSDFGITFPFKSKGYAEISAKASISSGYRCGFEDIELNSKTVHIPVKTSYDLDGFSSSIKECLENYRKENDVSWEKFVDFYQIEVEHVYVEASSKIESAIRRKIAKEEREAELAEKREELWDIYESVCYENYSDHESVMKAISRLNKISSDKEILAEWQQNSLQQCAQKLRSRSEELLFNDEEDEDDDEYSIENLYNAAIERARRAESNGDYYTAAEEYRTAYALDSQYWLQGKIKEMEQRAETQAIAAGTVTFITGMNEEFADLPTGRLNGTYVASFNYDNLNSASTAGLGGMEGTAIGAFLTFDQTFWFNDYKKLGVQVGVLGSYTEFWDSYEGNNSFTGGYSSQPSMLDLGAFTGINIAGRFELDYYFRGLAIKGEYSAEDPNSSQGRMDRPIGGELHFDGGVRTAFYLYNKKEFFIRASAWYVDALENSPVKFLDNSNNEDIQTVSYGYRIEFAKRPWSLVLYSRHDAYYSNEALNIGFDSWGIGLGFGLGTSL